MLGGMAFGGVVPAAASSAFGLADPEALAGSMDSGIGPPADRAACSSCGRPPEAADGSATVSEALGSDPAAGDAASSAGWDAPASAGSGVGDVEAAGAASSAADAPGASAAPSRPSATLSAGVSRVLASPVSAAASDGSAAGTTRAGPPPGSDVPFSSERPFSVPPLEALGAEASSAPALCSESGSAGVSADSGRPCGPVDAWPEGGVRPEASYFGASACPGASTSRRGSE